ncbi:VIT1/CCC1 transporter family protein [Allokutzneria sp. A3M-2-11 16]|uniref:VIT1/CCC1 transporter family protein n=1 Tax=Allokutzneria sp. A3M-2-11 16 TaxID=2962043 RepID=UPI0020B69AA1|nr:VIT1/CCC1 transporter family protein [Allokutzneria sp. A3M-2-11 16]MCP3804118.1 VIT1/CCC1 transporter family protein [Allokutzneria sp. A3M-2-11 16]
MLDRLSLNLVVAIGQPLLLVGVFAASKHLDAYGADDGWTTTLGVVLLVLTGITWLAGIALAASPFLVFAGMVASMIAMGALSSSSADTALHERGVRTTCDVVTVDRRVETRSHYDSDGTWSTTTTIYYDHRLRCDAGPIDTMTLHSRAAEPGQRLEITYDPLLRVDPVPANTVTDGSGSRQTALIAVIVAILSRVGGVLWERRQG